MLLNGKGVLKISDMGLAKYFGSPNRLMSSKIVTLLVNFNYLKNKSIEIIELLKFFLGLNIILTKLIFGQLGVLWQNCFAEDLSFRE